MTARVNMAFSHPQNYDSLQHECACLMLALCMKVLHEKGSINTDDECTSFSTLWLSSGSWTNEVEIWSGINHRRLSIVLSSSHIGKDLQVELMISTWGRNYPRHTCNMIPLNENRLLCLLGCTGVPSSLSGTSSSGAKFKLSRTLNLPQSPWMTRLEWTMRGSYVLVR
jgi:hypothetical protein